MTAYLDPVFGEAIANLQDGRLEDAERQFRAIVRERPRNPMALDLLGAVCAQQGHWREAEEYLTAAIAAGANVETTFYNHGVVLKELGRPADAIAQFDRAIAINPRSAEAWFDKAMCLLALKRYDAVQSNVAQALAINPRLVQAWVWLGHVLGDLGRDAEAFAAYDKALAVAPETADAWHGRARLLRRQRRHVEAIAAFDKTLTINPGLTAAWLDRGRMCLEGRQYDAAAASFSAALRLDPDAPFAKGYLQHVKMVMCDWRGFDASVADIERDISLGKPAADPVTWLALSGSGRSQRRCAETYSKHFFPASGERPPRIGRRSERLRIGYVSGDFRDHASTHLLVGALECHDRSRFEILAFDNGSDDGSEYRARVMKAVDGKEDISRLGTEHVVDRIKAKEIDILVNLNGYFGQARMDVFARRAAPVQVSYLGFPATSGAGYIDYIVADRHVIPAADRELYCEKVAYLPRCYQANDRKKQISGRKMTRAEAGLPEDGFVFCGFHKTSKILPRVFDVWMAILEAVDGGVLWLLSEHAPAQDNLRREAAARGIDPRRLVFARHLPLAEHLARHRLADLFLDTLPYNAHTTASDALWAGLPVLSQTGTSFAGRVGGSLLTTIGLPQLAVETPEQYRAAATALAHDRETLAAIRADLAAKRQTSPLFDTASYTRGLERAFEMMAERHWAGLPPDHLCVESEE